MNENNKALTVENVLEFETIDDFGIKNKIECKIELSDLGKKYKAVASVGTIKNEHIFNKKDIDKLSASPNSVLFKGFKVLDTNLILSAIQDLEKDLDTLKQQQQYMINQEYEKAQNEIIEKGKEFYDYCKHNNILPSNYIMAASRWKVADEEVNVLRFILAILSTIRSEPVNIISKSFAGTGKSIIEDTAFSMVHPHHYMILNFSTPAAFKNMCIGNPYVFKDKIVRYGDLGASVSEEVIAEVNSIIKQLNSEGYYKSNKMMGQEDIVEIELIGHCAMCFSKVENELALDPQDVSRGILIQPNLHNDKGYADFIDWVDYKDDNDFKYEDELFGNIRDYLEYLASLDLKILNPYKKTLNNLFKDNEIYRRLLVKQDSILKMLALINLPNKQIVDGDKIFVSNEDFELYYKLFHRSLIALMEFNVSEADIDLLNTLKNYYDGINEEEDYMEFINLLDDNNKDFYDDDLQYNESFFSVNDIVSDMSNVRTVHNIIGIAENDNTKRNRIRNSLHKLENFIGKFYIPDDNWKGRGGQKPTLYYIKKLDIKNKNIKYFISKKTLSIINKKYGKEVVKFIINDMKEHSNSFEKHKNMLVGYIEDVNDTTIFDCPVINNPDYMELEDFDLDDLWEDVV